MTKEEIIELQECTSRARALFWELLERGQHPSEDHARAVFTCFFALDKVCDLVSKFITQLPLEEPAQPAPQAPLMAADLPEFATPVTDSLWPPEPPVAPRRRKKVKP